MRAAAAWSTILCILVVTLVQAVSARLKDFRYMSRNISSTLDTLLAAGRYDKRLRPDLGGPPTLVTVSIYIKSMSSVSETEQKYSMDTYFRQSWFDPRLRFSLPGIDEFSMSWLFLDRVWKPDTYIVNGHRSYLHKITVPNKFLRVRADGFITYSMRVTLQANCPMHLRKFPLDSQRCPLLIGSYGYTSSDILYSWHPSAAVGLEPGVELAQYDLVNVSTTPEQRILRGSEEYSMIAAMFYLRRNTGYYTLQVFVPCGLIVCSSWVSFWIDPDAVPARVTLAVTTVLSMTTMGFGGRASMPRVNHATALDWFVIMCFAFVFAVLVEYAAINFIDKVTVDLRRLLEERRKKGSSGSADNTVGDLPPPSPAPGTTAGSTKAGQRSRSASLDATAAQGARRHRRKSSLPGGDEANAVPGPPPPPVTVTTADPQQGPSRAHSLDDDEIVYADVEGRTDSADPESAEPPRPKSADYVIPIEVITRSTESHGDLLRVPAQEGQDDFPLRRSASLRRCLSAPYRLWEQTRILPNEEDVSRQMLSQEEPNKFSKIDTVSRKVFPIAFGSMLIFYWVMYGYYITDRFPEDEDKIVLYKPAPCKNNRA